MDDDLVDVKVDDLLLRFTDVDDVMEEDIFSGVVVMGCCMCCCCCLTILLLFMAIMNSAASLSSSKSADKSSATPVRLQLKPQGGAIFLVELFELPLPPPPPLR